MEYEFDLHLTRADISLALRRFIGRQMGLGMGIAVGVCLVHVVIDLFDGSIGNLSQLILLILVLLGGIIGWAMYIRSKQAQDLLDKLGGEPVHYRLDEEGIEASSAMGSSLVTWEAMHGLWIYPELLMPFFSKGGYTTMPRAQLPEGALDFLRAKIEAAGGKIFVKGDA